MAAIPILYISSYVKDKQQQQELKDNLVQARIDKIHTDQEIIIEGRLPKVVSEVVLLELKIDKMKRELGLEFKPDNYKE